MNHQDRQLTQADRYPIKALCKLGFTEWQIAKKSTRLLGAISS